MTIRDAFTPIGMLVSGHANHARVFERRGIDYCCGGKNSLAHACEEQGLDVNEILRELEASGAQTDEADDVDWSNATIGELIDHIVATHHAYLHRDLPRLGELVDKVVEAHQVRHPQLRELRTVFHDFKDDLRLHMLKEEKVLFPMIRQMDCLDAELGLCGDRLDLPLQVMEQEHTETGAALQRMRELTNNYRPPADACVSYRALLNDLAELEADIHRHIHKENNILFSMARAVHVAHSGDKSEPVACRNSGPQASGPCPS
jgi:regulator of cell morphogenesis and NO signaling